MEDSVAHLTHNTHNPSFNNNFAALITHFDASYNTQLHALPESRQNPYCTLAAKKADCVTMQGALSGIAPKYDYQEGTCYSFAQAVPVQRF